MTRGEFDGRANEGCHACGAPVTLEDNPNNGATQVVCSTGICRLARRPWGQVINIKKSTEKKRKPLPRGETLDAIWQKFDNRCVMCGAPKSALATLGIGRQVHHVIPYAAEGHKGPLIPICTHCHPVVNERQRVYWFYQRVVMKSQSAIEHDDKPDSHEVQPAVIRTVE